MHYKPTMWLGKVLKCKSLEKRCTMAKASKPLSIDKPLCEKLLNNDFLR